MHGDRRWAQDTPTHSPGLVGHGRLLLCSRRSRPTVLTPISSAAIVGLAPGVARRRSSLSMTTHDESVLSIERTNTVLYCERWLETVAFYRTVLGLGVAFENDWFVEFQLTSSSFLSIADASRATIGAVEGQGVTLTWQVPTSANTNAARGQRRRRHRDQEPVGCGRVLLPRPRGSPHRALVGSDLTVAASAIAAPTSGADRPRSRARQSGPTGGAYRVCEAVGGFQRCQR